MTPNDKTRLDDETLATDLAVLGDDAGSEPQIGSAGHDGDGLSAFRFALYLGPHARLAEQAR